ncbi:Isochorismatase family protein [Rubrimonas cliftonensis]|uniref:Isochorismatase family protein n=1 Tax=Rubrimonas cliftonensis TaxID=89524 RepID=A0A1H4GJ40_9RHOB|nr:Isochorismatase family protein [Rubrimonas cliftonensis]
MSGKIDLLTPSNNQLIIIDHQPQMAFGVQSIDRQVLQSNVVALAKAVKVFDFPTTITTVEIESFSGHTDPEILSVFPKAPLLERTSMKSCDDRKVRNALAAIGRKNVVVAGLWTEVCNNSFALEAMHDGGIAIQHRMAAPGGGIAIQHRMAFLGEYFVQRYGRYAAEATPPVGWRLEAGGPGRRRRRRDARCFLRSVAGALVADHRQDARRAVGLRRGQRARPRGGASAPDAGLGVVLGRGGREVDAGAGRLRRPRRSLGRLLGRAARTRSATSNRC